MSDNAEEGIARTQIAGAQRAGDQSRVMLEQQSRGVTYLNERISIFIFSLVLIGLMLVWATTSSSWVKYGSFIAVLILIGLGWYTWVKRIERTKLQRQQEAVQWQSQNSK
ncbi:MAG: hypothetical protein ACI8P9_003926 [Parasphingorhabdus sp.]|jgi:hypothetical protein